MDKATNFSVVHRNPGHWDIVTKEYGRVFAIRGGPGYYFLRDERPGRQGTQNFKTLATAMAAVCDILMFELIVAEGQTPTIIEKWNVE